MVIAKNDLRSRWLAHNLVVAFLNECTPSPALPRNQVAGEGGGKRLVFGDFCREKFLTVSPIARVIYPKITSNKRSGAMGRQEVRPARIGSGRVAVGRTWPSAITYPALKCGVNEKRWGFVRFGQIILSAIGVSAQGDFKLDDGFSVGWYQFGNYFWRSVWCCVRELPS